MTDKEKAMALISDLANDFKPIVAGIEAKLATTRNHYGDYMALISQIAKDRGAAKIICVALIRAGASRQGVSDAMRICYGE